MRVNVVGKTQAGQPSLIIRFLAASVVVGLFALGVTRAEAQTEQSAQGAQQQPDPNRPIVVTSPDTLDEKLKPQWIKRCETLPDNKGDICQTSAELRNERGTAVLNLGVRTARDREPVLLVSMPTGVLLPPGFLLRVDNNSTEVKGVFILCDQGACISEVKITDGFVLEMKKGNDIFVLFRLASGQAIAARMPLSGITKALEGDPIQPEKLAEQNRAMEETLKKMAEDYRKEIEKKAADANGQAAQ